ncbi:MAG TPA: PilZ domain-containing protein, partial [Clostridia bacterium]|nr:PilZ domain-containing protein [Clostridia bacterium]
EIYFFKEEASFLFHGRVKKRFRINNAVVVSITRTSPIQRIQRREFYRLRVILPVDFWLLDDDIEDKPTVYKGYSIDISGGGLKLNTDYCLEVNTAIECRIDLGNERQLQIKGKVIRVNPAGGSGYRYELGISFCCVSHRVREDLIRFIFSKQRELREKGLI